MKVLGVGVRALGLGVRVLRLAVRALGFGSMRQDSIHTVQAMSLPRGQYQSSSVPLSNMYTHMS